MKCDKNSMIFLAGVALLICFCVIPSASGTEIWNGSRMTFSKASYADWTLPENQDAITPAVSLTRQNSRGLFNITTETEFNQSTRASPADTEWSVGTTDDLPLMFSNWDDFVLNSPDAVGVDAVVHLISDDIYMDIKFTGWASGGTGGGFSYERATGPSTLSITTSSLPAGTEMVPYSFQLGVTNGTAPYTWKAVYFEDADTNTYLDAGEPQGWTTNNQTWQLDLPFDFPFFGETYSQCWVDSSGRICFDGPGSDSSSSMEDLLATPMIAVMWGNYVPDGPGDDIRIEEGVNYITVCWNTAYSWWQSPAPPVNISATLYKDGTIKLSYGSGNQYGGMIGISDGLGDMHIISDYNNSGSMDSAADILFSTGLPTGILCPTNGLLFGIPGVVETNQITFRVKDASGDRAMVAMDLAVDANSNLKPVIDSTLPVTGYFDMSESLSAPFSVSAHDPEGGSLTYSWTLDGVDLSNATPSYVYTTDWGDAGEYALCCFISDDLWSNQIFQCWTVNVLNDNDSDGLPNDWEQLYLLSPWISSDADADPDGDQYSNIEEYVLGTHPGESSSPGSLLNISMSGIAFNTIQAQGTGYSNMTRHYRLEFTTNLVHSAWQTVPGWDDISASGNTETYAPPAGEIDFFRLKVWLSP